MGPYIGETLGRARSIVHFDPLLAATRNRPTAVAVTGEPGGGKTTLALLMIMQLALRGVTVAVIDPKGDAESLVDVLAARGRKARVLPGCSTRSRSATTWPRSGPWPPRRCGCCCRG
jgi:DNA helicase HerA-like ATPase